MTHKSWMNRNINMLCNCLFENIDNFWGFTQILTIGTLIDLYDNRGPRSWAPKPPTGIKLCCTVQTTGRISIVIYDIRQKCKWYFSVVKALNRRSLLAWVLGKTDGYKSYPLWCFRVFFHRWTCWSPRADDRRWRDVYHPSLQQLQPTCWLFLGWYRPSQSTKRALTADW